MKKVLVTGGAGFIGSHTCVELIAAGYLPVIVDDMRNSDDRILKGIEKIVQRKVVLHRIDCGIETELEKVFREEGPFFGAIHFAAYKSVNESVAEPVKYYANNIGSLVSLLNVSKRHNMNRLVFSSSCAVYGLATSLPVDEKAPATNANSPYGYTKVVCEQLLRDASHCDPDLRVVMLRYFNPVGAHPSALIGELPLGIPNNLVPYVMQTAAGLRNELTIYGSDYGTPDGTCQRDYLHVVDLAKAHVQALNFLNTASSERCEVFNLGTGRASSVKEVVDTFVRVTGAPVRSRMGPRRAGDVPSIFADASKAHKALGWSCAFDLADALRDAWAWQRTLDTDPVAASTP